MIECIRYIDIVYDLFRSDILNFITRSILLQVYVNISFTVYISRNNFNSDILYLISI